MGHLGQAGKIILATADGQPVITTTMSEETASRHSALSCALLSLSESFSQEALGISNNEISVSSEGGHAALLRLQLRDQLFLLCISTTDNSTNLAMVIHLARETGRKLQQIVDY
jgi:predicted regulator of Ras-like GTPase activity (Roadblock/LC7/MglB family)